MLFALGAASSAMGAIQSLTSGGSTSPASTGFGESAADLLDSAGASASTSPPPAAGSTGFSQLSPTTMSALLAAQGQSSTGSTSASDAMQDLSSQIDGDAGSSDSSATASSYNSLAQMFQQQINAMSFSAPPLSFSV